MIHGPVLSVSPALTFPSESAHALPLPPWPFVSARWLPVQIFQVGWKPSSRVGWVFHKKIGCQNFWGSWDTWNIKNSRSLSGKHTHLWTFTTNLSFHSDFLGHDETPSHQTRSEISSETNFKGQKTRKKCMPSFFGEMKQKIRLGISWEKPTHLGGHP